MDNAALSAGYDPETMAVLEPGTPDPSTLSYGYWGNTPGQDFARGGISDGPLSGYLATLHGRELVLPLDDPRRLMELLQESGLARDTSSLVGASGGYGVSFAGLSSDAVAAQTVDPYLGATEIIRRYLKDYVIGEHGDAERPIVINVNAPVYGTTPRTFGRMVVQEVRDAERRGEFRGASAAARSSLGGGT